MIVIANDITCVNGSFGTKEDQLYYLASKMSREAGIPRIYLAANSGARIGLAEEVKGQFQVAWNNPDDPSKGFQYLYFSEAEYQKLSATNSIIAEKIEVGGEVRYQLTDVIGMKPDLGVECLKGSGLIAGETSRAYQETCTITYTTVRTVGIGSYVLRLGQRSIMHEKSSIILTGSLALTPSVTLTLTLALTLTLTLDLILTAGLPLCPIHLLAGLHSTAWLPNSGATLPHRPNPNSYPLQALLH